MKMRIFLSRAKWIPCAVALVVGIGVLITLFALEHVENDRSSPEVVFHHQDAASPGVTDSSAEKKSPSIGVNHEADVTRKNPNNVSDGTPGLTLAAEWKAADDKDFSKLAEISRHALSCQARRVVLKRADALAQDIASAKTDDARALLQKDYDAFLPRVKKAEADTDLQCDSLSGSELEIVARESTLQASALGDGDAQMCAMYVWPEIFAVSNDEQQASIGRQAANHLAAGLDRGDWRAVRLYQRSCGRRAGVERLGLSCEGLPILRMQVILALGATGEKRKELMDDVDKVITEANSTGGLQLQGKTIRKAEVDSAINWAREEYRKHFQNSSHDYDQSTCISQGYGIPR